MDRNSPDYIPPQVQITTNIPDTVNSDSIRISWTGNEYIQKTSYYLSGYDTGWTAWDTTKSRNYKYLDEQTYSFYIKGIYANGDSATDSIHFFVDAISGPAIILYPQLSHAITNDTIGIQILLEDVIEFVAGKIVLSIPPNALSVTTIQKGSLFFSDDYNDIFIPTVTESSIIIEAGLSGGSNNGFTGSAAIANISAIVFQTDIEISVNKAGCKLKNATQGNQLVDAVRACQIK